MSTYWGFACVSHDPPLVSECWFNRGDDRLAEAFHLERAGEWPDDPKWPALENPMPMTYSDGLHGTAAPIHWLREHPRCEVVLQNEYGDTKPIPPREEAPR